MDIRFNKYSSSLLILLVGCLLMMIVRWLEQSLVASLLIGYPLLVCFGYMLGAWALKSRLITVMVRQTGGVPSVLLASFTLAFWMIPRWMDASVVNLDIAILKYFCLILLVGFALGCSWSRLHFITRAVVKIEFLTMLFRLGWIYVISPDRLCNNYLLGEQLLLGKSLLAIAVLVTLAFCFPLFFADSYEQNVREGKLS